MKKNILVVDDDEHLRELVGMIFSPYGHSVTKVATAEKAIGLLSDPSKHFDLILSDFNLGAGMDGLEFIEAAKVLTSAVFWFWSATLDDEAVTRAKSLKVRRIIRKGAHLNIAQMARDFEEDMASVPVTT